MGYDGLSSKQVGSQASRGWPEIQPVCISINAVPALKGLITVSLINKCPTKRYLRESRKLFARTVLVLSFTLPCISYLEVTSTFRMYWSSREWF